MVVATRVIVPKISAVLERRESPPCRAPSSVRIGCTLWRTYSSRRLGDGGRTVTDHRGKGLVTGEQTFLPDSSIFLRYEDLRRAVHGMLACMPLLQGVDVSSDNWLAHCSLEGVPASMLHQAREDDDNGRTGVHYHFSVTMAMKVDYVYSEPKAVVRACAETFVPPAPADQCSICMEDFSSQRGGGDAMSRLNLPCSHPFHKRCITMAI
jgi:hypothetical protein